MPVIRHKHTDRTLEPSWAGEYRTRRIMSGGAGQAGRRQAQRLLTIFSDQLVST